MSVAAVAAWGFAVLSSRVRPLLLGLVFGLGSFLGVVQAAPVAIAANGAPPACRYEDLLASPRAYADWNITLLDSIYGLPRSYTPPGLVSTTAAGLNDGGLVRRLTISDLAAMASAADKAGAGLRVVSGFRDWDWQLQLYVREVRNKGLVKGRLSVARPGHSEHQLGVTIDFGSARSDKSAWSYDDWALTKAGSWMKANAWKYGWIMSYPKGMHSITCYMYEPWHYRYVGRDEAAKVHASGLTLREYQWRHYR